MATKRPTVPRLLVSQTTATTVERERIRIAAETNREWSKTEIHDAIITIGMRHKNEVMALLLGEQPEEGGTDE
ncbi:hypothetical protein DMB42_52020 [Nonomuraea sp. WAC 01424]|uniref:hypothetical protein n=1 Tax=Nonomuraea sp. WAC 01424 TaxID=2203200 RepID=UPI000F770355|nr:hypothetical protein [Nonomuraea sp. WAC 01424]RSM93763.1 hypothetical protein DMB42_52020 [Nonomuraea sp. WAC 01424]